MNWLNNRLEKDQNQGNFFGTPALPVYLLVCKCVSVSVSECVYVREPSRTISCGGCRWSGCTYPDAARFFSVTESSLLSLIYNHPRSIPLSPPTVPAFSSVLRLLLLSPWLPQTNERCTFTHVSTRAVHCCFLSLQS